MTGGQTAQMRDMPLGEAMAIAHRAMAAGDVDTASLIVEQIAAAKPDYLDGLNFLAAIRFHQRRFVEAIEILETANRLSPENSAISNNLANAYLELEDFETAAHLYEEAMRLDADNVDALRNLGYLYLLRDRSDDAERLLTRALEIDRQNDRAEQRRANSGVPPGEAGPTSVGDSAASSYEPKSRISLQLLYLAHMQRNDSGSALRVLEQWLQDFPDDPEALHLIASLGSGEVPDRASDEYVEQVFDRFAGSFDSRLERLKYRAPELIGAIAADVFDSDGAGNRSILDAGCGTGLCGIHLREHAAVLTGVDLSAKMLAKAAARGCYDSLHRAEVTAFLLGKPDAYDAIIFGDCICYFGDLKPLLVATAGALRESALLIFTAEKAEEAHDLGYALTGTGRYAHGSAYLSASLKSCGFELIELRDEILRVEVGSEVCGLLGVARLARPPALQPNIAEQVTREPSNG